MKVDGDKLLQLKTISVKPLIFGKFLKKEFSFFLRLIEV